MEHVTNVLQQKQTCKKNERAKRIFAFMHCSNKKSNFHIALCKELCHTVHRKTEGIPIYKRNTEKAHMQHKAFCNKKTISILAIIVLLIGLTICGSVLDAEIANALYIGEMPSENPFGVLFAFLGILPTFVGWSFLGASMLCLSRKYIQRKTSKRWLTAFAVLLFVLSFFYFCNTLMMVNSNAFSVHWAIAYPLGTATLLGASLLGYRLSRQSNNPSLLRTVLLLSIVSVVVMIVIMSTKGIMDRPRFRFVLESANPDYFRNWWQSGTTLKESLAGNAVSDEFSSFPSGHSAYAMFAIFLFPAFAAYVPKCGKHQGLLTLSGFAWWCLTALSRITVGAHYLTDVCIAGLITILVWLIVNLVDHRICKETQTCAPALQ